MTTALPFPTLFPEIKIYPWMQTIIEAFQKPIFTLHKEEDDDDDDDDDDVIADLDVRAEARSRDTMDRLFGEDDDDDDDDDDDEEEEDSEEESEEDEEEESDEDSEEDDEDSEEDDEVDYDEEEEDEDEDEEEEEDPDARETIAQRQARENGRKVKQLEAEAAERELEFQRVQTELEEARTRLSDFESVQIDPTTDPKFVSIKDDIMRDVRRATTRLPSHAHTLPTHVGGYMDTFLQAEAQDGASQLTLMEDLKTKIATDLSGLEGPPDEWDAEEQQQANLIVDKVLDLLERNAAKTESLIQLEGEIRSKARSGRLEIGVKEYQKRLKLVEDLTDQFDKLEEDVIEADPFALPAIVARMTKDNPKGQQRLKQSLRDAQEVMFGPRPLTQKELDAMEERGVDIAAFMAEREKNHAAKVRKHFAMHVEHLVTRAETKRSFKLAAELKRKDDDEGDQLSMLGKATRPKSRKKQKSRTPSTQNGRAADRPLAISKYLR